MHLLCYNPSKPEFEVEAGSKTNEVPEPDSFASRLNLQGLYRGSTNSFGNTVRQILVDCSPDRHYNYSQKQQLPASERHTLPVSDFGALHTAKVTSDVLNVCLALLVVPNCLPQNSRLLKVNCRKCIHQ